ncbi:hypothetical protein BX666DRAFT_1859237 [Dichotomocladium elegans]|nr:hypothetical protein BX666DRAFT_1859237 [Dichotomocladium elegans]
MDPDPPRPSGRSTSTSSRDLSRPADQGNSAQRPRQNNNRPRRKPKVKATTNEDSPAGNPPRTNTGSPASGDVNRNKNRRRHRAKPSNSGASVAIAGEQVSVISNGTSADNSTERNQNPPPPQSANIAGFDEKKIAPQDQRGQQPQSRKKPARHRKPKVTDEGITQPRQPLISKNRPQGKLTDDGSVIPEENGTSSNVSSARNTRKPGKKKQHRNPDANDLAGGLAQDLKSATYECMVCWDVVRPAHQTWTCDCCWAVFHLSCVKKWATKSLQETETNKPITNWRCPGCQHTRTVIPKDYMCFCGKQRNPEPNRYITPHSCGQLCKKSKNCPHACVLQCHPGPCPPCTAMAPPVTCYCGRHTRQVRCTEMDYSSRGYECEEQCAELLGCEKHVCQENCHKGVCPPCPIEEIQSCYCGKDERIVRCSTGTGVQSGDHVGFYQCENICERMFACGQHRCQKRCHQQDTEDSTCPFDPSVVKTCPCGAKPIQDLLDGSERTVCSDPIPTCQSSCGKELPCGHVCKEKCHLGSCPPCEELVEVRCRCRSTTFQATCASVCEAAGGEPPLCNKVCRAMKNCGRHQCGTVCCPASKQRNNKKNSVRDNGMLHDCPLTCGRTLSCAIHQCQAPCHKGQCRPCMEAVFDEVTCNCGRTRLEPPVRCGTVLPPCPYPCTRPTSCGHIRLLNHNCHPDDEPCPPCAVLVSRMCVCGKTELKNVPCYRESPRCGRVCDKPLACGQHHCNKTCHKGPCLEEGETCLQTCNKKRRCGHPCTSKCHGSDPCPEEEPCGALVRVACKCGQNSLQVPCNATSTSPGTKRELDCNDFCAKVERNRKLAMALNIERKPEDESGPTTDELGYFDDSLCNFYLENRNWAKYIETMLIDFVKGPNRTLHCKPMKPGFRHFLHRYCVHFNLATESVDPEPHRSVVIRKTLGQCRIPSPLLSVAAHHPTMNRPPAPSATPKATTKSLQPVNALCLSDLPFGLIKTELDMELDQVFGDTKYTSEWMTDADAVLIIPVADESMAMEDKEAMIWDFKKAIKNKLDASDKSSRVDCCWVDRSGKISWTERKAALEQEIKQAKEQPRHHSPNIFNVLQSDTEEPTAADAWDQESLIESSAAMGIGEENA